MANIAALTLNAQTFAPFTPQVGTVPAQWNEKSTTQLSGYKKISIAVTQSKDSSTAKVRATGYIPVLDVDGNVSRFSSFTLTVNKASTSTDVEKADLLAILTSLIADSAFTAAVLTDEVVY
jgi:hypothetical protein